MHHSGLLLLCTILILVVVTTVMGDEKLVASGSGKEEDSGSEGTAAEEAEKAAAKKNVKSSKDWKKIDFNDLEKQWEKGDAAEEMEYEYQHSEKIMKRKTREAAKQAKAKAAKAKAKSTKEPANSKKTASKGKNSGGKKKAANAQEEGNGDWIPPPPGLENIDMSQTKGPGGMQGLPPELQGLDLNNMDSAQTEKDMGPQMWFVDISMKQEEGPDRGKRWTRTALDKLAAHWGEMMKTAHLSAKMYVIGEYKTDPQTNEETGPTLLVSLDKAWQQKEITKYVATGPEVIKLTKDRKTLTRLNFLDDDDDDDEL